LPSKSWEKCLAALAGPFFGAIPSHLRPILWCVGETVLEHVGPQFRVCLIHSLVIPNFLPREREESLISHSLESMFLEELVQCAIYPVLGNKLAGTARFKIGIILIWHFFSRLPNCQIKNLTQFSCYTVSAGGKSPPVEILIKLCIDACLGWL